MILKKVNGMNLFCFVRKTVLCKILPFIDLIFGNALSQSGLFFVIVLIGAITVKLLRMLCALLQNFL